MNPKVSIVLPTYNGERYIRQSIDSCLKQTYSNIEIIIIDDCSTDKTPQIIKSYADPRIKYIRNETNQRLPRSLNIGFKATSGDYVTWTSDDNLYAPNAIEKMVEVLQAGQFEFVYADIFAFHGDSWQAAQQERLYSPDTITKANCVRACFLYTRKVMETVGGYDPDMELIEDYDYWIRVSQRFSIFHIPEPLYYYRYHAQQLYTARYREIKIIESLFKAKYDLSPLNMVNWYIRDAIIQRSIGLPVIKSLLSRLYYKPRIAKILNTYKEGGLSFTAARKAIYELTRHFRWQPFKTHFVFFRRLPAPPQGEWGGLECVMMDFLRRADYQSCRISIAVTPGWKERFLKELNGLPVEVIEIPFSFDLKPIERFLAMHRFLKSIKANVAVFFQAWLWEFRFMDVLAANLATDHVYMHENLGAPAPVAKTSKKHLGFIPGLAIWWYIPKYLTSLRAYLSRKIIVVSNEIKERLVSLWGYPEGKVEVCYHGIDVHAYGPSSEIRTKMRDSLDLSDKEVLIFLAVRLTEQKRVDRAIEAFEIINKDFPDLRFLIAGSGPLDVPLKKLAQSKPCSSKIKFLGHVNNVSQYLRMSDINLLTSDNEGFGISLVEAMATGLICISTHCPGPSEILRDGTNGFLVEKSVLGVAAGLTKALRLSPQEREEMAQNAVNDARSNFEINKNVYKAFAAMQIPFLGKV